MIPSVLRKIARHDYNYSRCTAFLVKENEPNSLRGATLVGFCESEDRDRTSNRDIYIEVPEAEEGHYWLYIDI